MTSLRRSALCASLALGLAACGSKTGLETPDVLDLPEAGVDVVDVRDATRDVPTDVRRRLVQCRPVRYFTRIGVVVNIRPDLDTIVPGPGYSWAVDASPEMNTRLLQDGSEVAVLTPLRPGEYRFTVTVPTPTESGAPLTCPVTVVADLQDPRCPGYNITEPRIAELSASGVRVAYDITWTAPRAATASGQSAVAVEDTAARVAAAAIAFPARSFESDPARWIEAEGTAIESALSSALGATIVLAGRRGVTHDGSLLRRTTMRIASGTPRGPDAVRDLAVRALTPAAPGESEFPIGPAQTFYVDVSTVIRAADRSVVVLLAVAPTALVDDNTQPAALRIADAVNGTNISLPGETLQIRCHAVTATRTLLADFLWFVDTSGSMLDDQERVGNTARDFFRDMDSAGVDFRVGVMQAATEPINLMREPGSSRSFRWIPGTATDGSQQLAFQVTESQYQRMSADTLKPYRLALSGQAEQPVGAAVITFEELIRRAAAGETNPEFRLRTDASRVAFFVTDEPGDSNDIGRFFTTRTAMFGSTTDITALTRNVARWFTDRNIVPFGLVPDYDSSPRCPSARNFARCVISAANGAFIPITLADTVEADAAFRSAMSRIVDTVAGSASEFVLPTIPLSSSLRVRVANTLAPRSRAEGFDYEDNSRALVFRGTQYRPTRGQEVRAAYFVWVRE